MRSWWATTASSSMVRSLSMMSMIWCQQERTTRSAVLIFWSTQRLDSSSK